MSDTDKVVMTVLGPIRPEDSGVILPHEHLFLDLTCYWIQPTEMTLRAFAEEPVGLENLWRIRRNPLVNKDNCRLDNFDVAVNELREYANLGGGTLIDVTPPDIGRDLPALQAVSRLTGTHIVAGSAHYVFLAHPATLADQSVEAVAEEFVAELSEGVGPTKVRTGILGEIGTSDPIRSGEEKTLRAAALASAQTGAAITVHLHPATRTGHDVFRILDEAGADPSRIVMGHLDFALGALDMTVDEAVKYQASLADYGCYIQFDGVGHEAYSEASGYEQPFWEPPDRVRAEAVARLLDAGYGDRMLLSHDVCHKYHLTRYGGFGYGHILRTFAQNLRDFGLGDAELQQLLVDNPQRMVARPAVKQAANKASLRK